MQDGHADNKIYPHAVDEFGRELRKFCMAPGLPYNQVSGYSVRRGGATFHFQKDGSLSKTTLAGRWASERTAHIYSDCSMAQIASLAASSLAIGVAKRAHDCCMTCFRKLLEQRNEC